MKKNTKKLVLISLIIILLAGSVVGILYGTGVIGSEKEPEQEIQPPVEEIVENVEEEVPEVQVDEPEEVVIPIDFKHWKETNEHIYAWVSIEDTNIEYPILQHPTDNAYYLDHTVDHVAGLPGSIYTENRNTKDFSDFNTLIYGHNMKDGSMFKHLHKFRDKEFFDTHDTVMIYTEDQSLTYKIYAAVIYSNDHILIKYDNASVEDRQAFIQSLHDIKSSTKLFREGMTIDENSKLITMSTCTGDTNTRLLVIAELVENK